jgi:ribosomal protein S18 acetylase RimI-like enzyme
MSDREARAVPAGEDRETQFRQAGPGDAETVALLHADSWRRHFRGAYADSFLDGDVVADRLTVWRSRRRAQVDGATTIIAQDGTGLAGFVHVIFDEDTRWGSLVDNLRVARDRRRMGIGRALLTRAAEAVAGRAAGTCIYLWVLEQNSDAQQFYRAMRGTRVETAQASPPGGVPIRLNGRPGKFRFMGPDCSLLLTRGMMSSCL